MIFELSHIDSTPVCDHHSTGLSTHFSTVTLSSSTYDLRYLPQFFLAPNRPNPINSPAPFPQRNICSLPPSPSPSPILTSSLTTSHTSHDPSPHSILLAPSPPLSPSLTRTSLLCLLRIYSSSTPPTSSPTLLFLSLTESQASLSIRGGLHC